MSVAWSKYMIARETRHVRDEGNVVDFAVVAMVCLLLATIMLVAR